MESIHLRAATLADLPACAAIYAYHVRTGLASFETEAPSESEFRNRFANITGGGYPYLVGVAGGTVLGYAYASPFRARPAYRHTVEDSIYIAANARGRGLGKTLLLLLINECAARDYRQMLAVIGDSGNAASIRLHRACGFERMAIFVGTGFKFGRWVDTVFMQRELGAGATTLPASD